MNHRGTETPRFRGVRVSVPLWFISSLVLLTLVVSSLSTPAPPQPLPYDEGSVGLALALRRLPVTASLLHTAAHPDDEDNPLLVMLSRGRGIRTALLTLTRGAGGQNEIGPELFEALAVVRTEELMGTHRYDAARQFFGRAYDFGYSFSLEENLEKWVKEQTLKDVVGVIRTFRPDVIITLPQKSSAGGQAHQAAARLTVEAFRAAADPARFPEQIKEGLRPWQAKKIYERYGWEGSADSDQGSTAILTVNTNVFDPLLGRTHFQLGMEARSYHQSQGMAQLVPLPGRGSSRWKLVDAAIQANHPQRDLFDGIGTDLSALKEYVRAEENKVPFLDGALTRLEEHMREARRAYNVDALEQTAPALAAGLQTVRELLTGIQSSQLDEDSRYQLVFLLRHKEQDFSEALQRARQLGLDVLSDEGMVSPGQQFQVVATLSNGSPDPVVVDAIELLAPAGWRASPTGEMPSQIPGHATVEQHFSVAVPEDAELTRPYWKLDREQERYTLLKPEHFGRPWSPPVLEVHLRYRSDGVQSTLESPVQYRYPGPWVGGEQRHELLAVPELSLRVDPEITIVPLDQAPQGRLIRITATYNGKDPGAAEIRLRLPEGWKSKPERTQISFDRQGQSVTSKLLLSAWRGPDSGSFEISVAGQMNGKTYQEGYRIVDYHHIQRRLLFYPSRMTLKTVDVAVKPGLRVGYITGVGDHVPQALEQLGVRYNLLSEDDLASGDLGQYDTIITGVRAYLNREDLKTYNHRLLEWVREGGSLIVQYNKFEFNGPFAQGRGASRAQNSPYSPYPARVGSGRVTDENTPVKILIPEHPVFHVPNEITQDDWSGWVQERGLYFLGDKDPRYQDLVSMEDPFEYNSGEKLGALVETRYGKGRWIYVGLGLWRQLPAGVPGAYRVLANLVSLGD